MKAKVVGRIIGAIVIIVMFLIGMAIKRDDVSTGVSGTNSRHDNTTDVTVTKSRTRVYDIVSDFSVKAVRDDVTYVCHFNQNDGNGGWLDVIPSRRSRPPNWRAKDYPSKLMSVSFEIPADSHIDIAVLRCTGIR